MIGRFKGRGRERGRERGRGREGGREAGREGERERREWRLYEAASEGEEGRGVIILDGDVGTLRVAM